MEKDEMERMGRLGLDQMPPGKLKIKENCRYKIFDVARSKRDLPGVYVIRTDYLDAVWVGETSNISDRMDCHIHRFDGSNLIWELAHSKHFPQYKDSRDRLKKEVKCFLVEFVVVEGGRKRRRAVEEFVDKQLRPHSPLLLNTRWGGLSESRHR